MDNKKNTAVSLQSWIALFLAGAVVWECADFLKLFLFHGVYDDISRWALTFYNPHESGLLNYLLFCLGLGAAGLAVYCRPLDRGFLSKIIDGTQRSYIRLFSALFLLALANAVLRSNFGPAAVFRLALVAVPLVWSLDYGSLGKKLPAAVTLIILFFLCLEPLTVALSPVRLMNEYANLYGVTLVDNGYIRNRDFAEYRSRGARVEDEEDFLKKNILELHHQATTRGQINHMGHVLNPINEYTAGKPLRDIYLQYGVGNTLLIKWTMDFFGGLSVQNYYKCYLYYIAYYVFFLLALVYVFRNSFYVLAGMAALAASQFFFGYMSFLLGPGLLPTLHFCDVFALAFLAGFLRAPERTGRLVLAFLAAAAGALLNRQFGGILAAALTITVLFFAAENASGRARAALAGAALAAFSLILAASVFLHSKAGHGVLGAFLSGYFSWNPSPSIVLFTLLYVSASYIFLALFRESRNPFKYLCIFAFLYAQGLLVYFYWSGLMHHLPMPAPFISLHLLLSLAFVENKTLAEGGALSAGFLRLKKAALILVLLCVPVSASYFYRGHFSEITFSKSFAAHKVHKWDFGRARLLSTIDPQPIKESLSQLARYSDEKEKGIYIISRYDNLLPLLAGRYSRFPVFEMSWYMLRKDIGPKVAARLENDKPGYIFVDTDLTENKPDLWTQAYGEGEVFIKDENRSRLERLMELKRIFLAVSPRYALVEKGPLLSVYRRIGEEAPEKPELVPPHSRKPAGGSSPPGSQKW